ncbi:O-antigen ligase family protein [Hahella sp. CR1]|uniref:O-antigen ligase family protein n=1 Tax=Hahella sp. CR1 TaxID=2992807 RepID=UPI002442F14A|nr:O-antigen ligase family protein [Hahella sp. CR1]MDG9667860.1 O-antigen ligase family protein [Hahella sp. CR1]
MNFPQLGHYPGPNKQKKSSEQPPRSDMERLYSMDIKFIYQTIRAEGFAFICICGYLFFEYVRPQSIYLWLNILPWVPLFIMSAFLFHCVEKKKKVDTGHGINKLMVLYGVVVLLSSAASEYSGASFNRLWTFFDWFLFYFMIVTIVNNEKRFYIFFLSFLIYSFKMSQHGFISWMNRGFAFASWGVTGAPGWFQNSGEVGIQMAIFTPLSVAFLLGISLYINKYWKIFFSLFPFTAIGTVIASSSRGALVAVIGIGVLALAKTKHFFKTAIVAGLVGWIVVVSVPDEFKARFETSGEDRTSLHRIERWEQGWETMKKYPVLGVGHEAWTTYHPRHFSSEVKGSKLVHNIFVQCGTELGFAGITVLVLLILASFVTDYKVRKLAKKMENRLYHSLAFGFDFAMIGFLISASFVTVLYYPYLWIHLALVVCMHNSIKRTYKEQQLKERESKLVGEAL